MDARTQVEERLLRGLGIAVKTFALYPPPHPVSERAVDAFLTALQSYQEAHGPLAVRITKQSLVVGDRTYRDGPHARLALFLFARRITSIKIVPEIQAASLLTLASTLSMDREALEAAGGAGHLLRRAGVQEITVTEVTDDEAGEIEGEGDALDPAGILEMLGRRRPSRAERERVLEVLHAGPGQVALLLQRVQATAAGRRKASDGTGGVGRMHQAVRGLDRLILDEPFEDQPALRAALAGGLARLEEPAQPALLQAITEARGDGVAGRLYAARPEALAALAPPERAPHQAGDGFPPGFEFGDPAAAAPADAEARLTALASADEAEAQHAGGATLARLLRHMPEGLSPGVTAELAADAMVHLTWLADRREHAALAAMLAALCDGDADGPAAWLMPQIAESPLLGALVEALWNVRGTPAAAEVRGCLNALGGAAIGPLVRMLGDESRGGVRALLGDVLTEAAADRVDDLGAWITDERWYVLRNIAGILGRLRNPGAVRYLRRLVAHEDYRVRRETLDALAAIRTADAQEAMAAFLDDPDERLRLRALQSLDATAADRVLPRLHAVLEQPDPLYREFTLKQAVLEAIARIGSRESLPTLARLSGTRLTLGPQAQALRRLAAQAVERIERNRSGGERPGGPNGPEDPAS